MPTCPAGHDTTTDDYCDVCGAPLATDTSPGEPAAVAAPVATRICAACGTPQVGRFCEECGHDSLDTAAPAPPAATPRAWHAVVTADRAYFDRVVAAGGPDSAAVEFPLYCPERRFVLHDDRISIGRRSRSRGIFPDIDLIGPPEDLGVSASHAMLVRTGGTWAVVDLDSTNGTTVNDTDRALPPHDPHPLTDGDRVHLGAWTTLTIRLA
ncbi:FHA domain-containing protein [Umezawaea endophytica]|uniref:FHA domain-containing protein n=1 Tax=Umezawaea endophytica TaxID=1654476 RepID=A0A9X2VQG5_9PSEU|nr:FHA domain-containing protein [Umezawaea endophytica]MCS7479588.1 FHA domain-containing protein [Umezawaea endophytica]